MLPAGGNGRCLGRPANLGFPLRCLRAINRPLAVRVVGATEIGSATRHFEHELREASGTTRCRFHFLIQIVADPPLNTVNTVIRVQSRGMRSFFLHGTVGLGLRLRAKVSFPASPVHKQRDNDESRSLTGALRSQLQVRGPPFRPGRSGSGGFGRLTGPLAKPRHFTHTSSSTPIYTIR